MKTKRKGITAYVGILLLVVLCTLFFAYFTDCFRKEFQSVAVYVNGQRLYGSSDGYTLSVKKPLKVKVVFAGITDKKISAEIVPAVGADFEYYAGEEKKKFGDAESYTDGFNITSDGNVLYVAPKGTLREILEIVSDGKEVRYDPLNEQEPFTLVITTGGTIVRIRFGVSDGVSKIILSEEAITF